MLDLHDFEAAFWRWVGMLIPALGADQVVAIDGKTSRRSIRKAEPTPLHAVSAFGAGVGVVVGQCATDEKSNEITAIPDLLATLAHKACIVTIDAMDTQTSIAPDSRTAEADYVLCVKDNHPKLVKSILLARCNGPQGKRLEPISQCETSTSGHGSTEVRRYWTFDADELFSKPEWGPDLKSFTVVERVQTVGKHTFTDRCYYLSSLAADGEKIAQADRSHWKVENRLHWCLDVQFNDDQSRVREGYAANNLALVRHILLNLVRPSTSRKGSIKTKRLLAASSNQYRSELLGFWV